MPDLKLLLLGSLTCLICGCSIHLLPEDVTRTATFPIVQKIRCETRQAIRDHALLRPLSTDALKKISDNAAAKLETFSSRVSSESTIIAKRIAEGKNAPPDETPKEREARTERLSKNESQKRSLDKLKKGHRSKQRHLDQKIYQSGNCVSFSKGPPGACSRLQL